MEDDKKLALSMQKFTPEEFKYLYKKSLMNKKISYLPYLLPIRQIFSIPIDQKTVKTNLEYEEKYLSKSTYDLLFEIDELFKRYSNVKKIKKITKVLLKRADFFEESMKFLEVKNVTYDELYYWYPGLKVADTLSLILIRYPANEFASKYKRFIGERILFEGKGHLKVLNSKIQPSLISEIDIMVADMTRFEEGNIICHNYWCDECCEENICVENKQYKYFPAYCYTYCLIEIDGKEFQVTLKKIRQLVCKDESVRDYWVEKGINWNEMPEIIGLDQKWLSQRENI
ncbi:hypothetical protein DMUE_3962 [Dictyocoela muelleri]|nr:hypothetical protein DMUE_3962 [Dictyocoela muelleri]